MWTKSVRFDIILTSFEVFDKQKPKILARKKDQLYRKHGKEFMVTQSLRRLNYMEKLSLKNIDNSDFVFAKPILEELKIQNPVQNFFKENEERIKKKSKMMELSSSAMKKARRKVDTKRGLSALFNKVVNELDEEKKPKKQRYKAEIVGVKSIEK